MSSYLGAWNPPAPGGKTQLLERRDQRHKDQMHLQAPALSTGSILGLLYTLIALTVTFQA